MKRPARLQKAKAWISKYNGKNIVKGYRKKFGVDILCAIHELELLGYTFSDQYKKSVKASIAATQRKKNEKKQKKESEQLWDCDDYFAYIIGYTSGGFPYGITWDEWDENKDEKTLGESDDFLEDP